MMERYTFNMGDKCMSLLNYDIEQAMRLADTMLPTTCDGFWKSDKTGKVYTWTLIPNYLGVS